MERLAALLLAKSGQCFGEGGLCPRAIHPLPPPPEESLTDLELPFPSNRMDCFGSRLCAHVFTDGSGGSTGSDRRRRRCGWSVVQVDEEGKALGILTGNIGGPLQTGPVRSLSLLSEP